MCPRRWIRIVAIGFCTLAASGAEAQRAPESQDDPEPTYTPPVMELPPPPTVMADTVIQVRRKKLSLQEIIERSIEGERTKLTGRESMVYTGNGKAVLTFKRKRLQIDFVTRTYASADGFERDIDLGDRIQVFRKEDDAWVLDPDADESEQTEGFAVRDGGVNDFGDLPVWLDATHEFDYELLDRFVQTNSVIFKIRFRPKSEFKPLPSGILYVDTDRYRIIHEEFTFEKNPFPLLVKDLKHLSRHWEELPTGEWVWTKVRGEVVLRGDPFFDQIPQRAVFAIERSDFAFDVPYDTSVFGER